MSAHSQFAPSSCERYWNCPGSVRMTKDTPSSASESSAEGTVAHALGAALLGKRVTETGLRKLVGQTAPQDGFDITITDDMIDCVMMYEAEINRVRKDLKTDFGPQWVEGIERGFQLNEDIFGTFDYGVSHPVGVIVADYKHGKGHGVAVEGNKQLMNYALGVRKAMARSRLPGKHFATLIIVQPRNGGIKRANVSFEELDAFEAELARKVEACKKDDAPCISGDWCLFCGAKGKCPVVRARAIETLKRDFAPVGKKFLPPEQLKPEQIARVLDYRDTVEEWLGAVAAYAKQVVDAGGDIPGYKLAVGKAKRQWGDEATAEAEFTKILGEKAYAKKLKSPAQMEKDAGKETVALYAFKPEGKKTLVKMDDARPELANSLATDFSPVEQLP